MILTAPSFGNTWNLDFRIVSRRLLGNELKTVVDPNWPIIERLSVLYESLSTLAKNALETDILAGMGNQVVLTDWEGTNWIGTIVGDLTIKEDHRDCGWSVQFDFEGILA